MRSGMPLVQRRCDPMPRPEPVTATQSCKPGADDGDTRLPAPRCPGPRGRHRADRRRPDRQTRLPPPLRRSGTSGGKRPTRRRPLLRVPRALRRPGGRETLPIRGARTAAAALRVSGVRDDRRPWTGPWDTSLTASPFAALRDDRPRRRRIANSRRRRKGPAPSPNTALPAERVAQPAAVSLVAVVSRCSRMCCGSSDELRVPERLELVVPYSASLPNVVDACETLPNSKTHVPSTLRLAPVRVEVARAFRRHGAATERGRGARRTR